MKLPPIVDIVFHLPSICMPDPKNSKILTFHHRGVETSSLTWYNPFRHQGTRSAILGQNALSQPRVDQKSKLVKITPKPHFSCFYIKPELFGDFRHLWPSLTWRWLKRAPEILILIRLSKQVETNAIEKIIKFSFQPLFMGQNRS